MASFTNQVTIVCSNLSEYQNLLDKAQNYAPNPGEPAMSSLAGDEPNLTITYTMTTTGSVA